MRPVRISFAKRIIVIMLAIMGLVWGLPLRTLAGGITRIDSSTFRGTPGITSIHIGSDVTEITSGAFRGLMKLRSITVSEDNPFYT